MIYLVIGGSCAGKSTFTKKRFLNGKDYQEHRDLLPYIETSDSIIIGSIKENSRRFGTDTINRRYINLIVEQVKRLLEKNKDIVLEGDRIVNRNIFNDLIETKEKIKLYLIDVSLETCLKRNQEINTISSESHLKGLITKSKNIFEEYKDILDGEIISSEPKEIEIIETNNFRDDFAIFILSHGRADKVKTLKTLKTCGYTGKWYIIIDNEDKSADEYYKLYGKEHIVMFDKLEKAKEVDVCDLQTKRNIVLFARNSCHQIAKDLGLTYFLELDDDYIEFRYRYNKDNTLSSMLVGDMNSIINETLEFLENSGALTVAFAQAGDFIGGIECSMFKNRLVRKAMNSFFCKVDRPFEFKGRINEDVNAYVLYGTQGKLMFTIADIVLNQGDTQQYSGGLTETYLENGTYVKSFYSVMINPSCVKISTMGVNHQRIHHSIDWEHCLPKILNEKWKK